MSPANFKIDLHTHSTASADGGIKPEQYHQALRQGLLDFVAVTDHGTIGMAMQLQRELGDKIIVGEEVMTQDGEIIGLFLNAAVEPGQTLPETIRQIKEQGGLVYVPHPFETYRKGLHPKTVEEVRESIDIIEVCNGRAFLQNRSEQAVVWARINQVPGASSSDAHGYRGLGKTYTSISGQPTKENLPGLLSSGRHITDRPSISSLLYPKYHKLRKRIAGNG